MIKRPIILLLFINFVIGTLILINFKNKSTARVSTNIISDDKSLTQVEPAQIEKLSNKDILAQTNTDDSVCIEYGPLDFDQKSIFDTILAKENVSVAKEKRNQFEIFWNLGANEQDAKEMFERQKSGALQDAKFKLVLSENNWIVPITIVNDHVETAKKLASQLGEKANKVNAGGRWQYRTLVDAYYYQIPDIKVLSNSTITKITKSMDIDKKPCPT